MSAYTQFFYRKRIEIKKFLIINTNINFNLQHKKQQEMNTNKLLSNDKYPYI